MIENVFVLCPRCGNKTIEKRNYLICESCGLKNYKYERACSGIIPISDNKKILLISRAHDPQKNMLDIIGGFLEEGETFEAGAMREAKEELNFKPSQLEYLGSYSHIYLYQGVNYWVVTAVFTCPIKSNIKLTSNDDVASYKFYSIRKLPYNKLAFSEQIAVLKGLVSRLK